ncbi:MAG: GNAT family N-acetyltransferase [Lysobacter sp.]
MNPIRPCRADEHDEILRIVNAAAEAYRGVIPADRWHEPYMSAQELRDEVAAGVEFYGIEVEGELLGVMGIQPVRDVDLIRHAYVSPGRQRSGIGAALLAYLRERAQRPVLVGTWADAQWAIAFYQRNGFAMVPRTRAIALLRSYWRIPQRQIETSVVLELAGEARDPTENAANI